MEYLGEVPRVFGNTRKMADDKGLRVWLRKTAAMFYRVVFKVLCVSLLASVAGADRTTFVMPVSDSFAIAGRGMVVSGTVERGSVKVSDNVELVGIYPAKPVTVTAIQHKGKDVQEALAGQEVGLILRGVSKDEVQRGQVLAEPGCLKAFRQASAKIALLATQEGGRKTPISTGYRSMCRFRGVDFSGTVQLPKSQSAMQPGQSEVTVDLRLEQPVALENGQSFEIREAGKTVGRGVIVSAIE